MPRSDINGTTDESSSATPPPKAVALTWRTRAPRAGGERSELFDYGVADDRAVLFESARG
jgi:hypothetical protein